jgi:hypothetical protein
MVAVEVRSDKYEVNCLSDGDLILNIRSRLEGTATISCYFDLREAISMEKRYFTSDLSILS